MKQKKFYILIISLMACAWANAQSVSDVVAFANAQFNEGNYTIAAREYNRAFFFGYEHMDVVSLQIGHCYTEMDDYEMAASFYDRAYKYTTSDSLKNESVLGKTFCMLMLGKNIQAIEELLYINEEVFSEQTAQMHFLRGIACYNLQDDSTAYEELYSALEISVNADSLQQLLTAEFEKVNRYQKRYNPTRSYIMSALIPGSGQIAVGAYKEGINSTLLVAGLALVAIQIIRSYSFIDAAITLLPWVQRYYMGGMDKAKALAMSKIEEKRFESYQRIVELTSPISYR